MLESNKKKKPTKAQMINEIIPKQFEEELKKSHIKGLVQGFELANQMLLEYGQDKTIEEVLNFCKKNIEDKTMSKMVSGKEKIDE